MKALSLGDWTPEPPVSKGKDLAVFTESFTRIKTSLIMALDRMKERMLDMFLLSMIKKPCPMA